MTQTDNHSWTFPRVSLLFGMAMALVGGYFIWHSFAATATSTSDLNNDGQVNIQDLSLLLISFGKAGPVGDIDNNGIVNIFDLSKLLADFGKQITPPPPPPAPGGLPSGALSADQSKRVYVGYYPSWSDNWFDSTSKTAAEVYGLSKFARAPATYTHIIAAFADPNFSWNGATTNNWSGTGLNFNATPRDIKASIDVLHKRNIKVLLAVGGATYNNWSALAAEGQAGSGPITAALASFMRDMGFDGLDVDYEADANVDRYANATKAMRRAVDQAGGGRILTLAGWSTGADCTPATTADAACAGKASYWSDKAGRERLLASHYPTVAAGLDMVDVMTYDARFEHYDGITGWTQYRNLFAAHTIVSIGLETSPEGWQGGNLVINDADAQCEGSRILQDQYGANLNLPYSVNRYTTGVRSSTLANRNPRDGAMLWSMLKTASGSCGSAPLASPGTIGAKISSQFGLPSDPLLQSSDWK